MKKILEKGEETVKKYFLQWHFSLNLYKIGLKILLTAANNFHNVNVNVSVKKKNGVATEVIGKHFCINYSNSTQMVFEFFMDIKLKMLLMFLRKLNFYWFLWNICILHEIDCVWRYSQRWPDSRGLLTLWVHILFSRMKE